MDELENYYKLGYGIIHGSEQKVIDTITKILNTKSKMIYQEEEKMLSEKIDFSEFLIWFILFFKLS